MSRRAPDSDDMHGARHQTPHKLTIWLEPINDAARACARLRANAHILCKVEGTDEACLCFPRPWLFGDPIATLGSAPPSSIRLPGSMPALQCTLFDTVARKYVLQDDSPDASTEVLDDPAGTTSTFPFDKKGKGTGPRTVAVWPGHNGVVQFGHDVATRLVFRIGWNRSWHATRATLRCRLPTPSRLMDLACTVAVGHTGAVSTDMIEDSHTGGIVVVRRISVPQKQTQRQASWTERIRDVSRLAPCTDVEHPNLTASVVRYSGNIIEIRTATATQLRVTDLAHDTTCRPAMFQEALVCDMLAALVYLEQRGVVHTDVCPDNMAYYEASLGPGTPGFHFQLTGFRVSKMAHALSSDAWANSFSAPEALYDGWSNLTPKADAYSLYASVVWATSAEYRARHHWADHEWLQSYAARPNGFIDALRDMADPCPKRRKSALEMYGYLNENRDLCPRIAHLPVVPPAPGVGANPRPSEDYYDPKMPIHIPSKAQPSACVALPATQEAPIRPSLRCQIRDATDDDATDGSVSSTTDSVDTKDESANQWESFSSVAVTDDGHENNWAATEPDQKTFYSQNNWSRSMSLASYDSSGRFGPRPMQTADYERVCFGRIDPILEASTPRSLQPELTPGKRANRSLSARLYANGATVSSSRTGTGSATKQTRETQHVQSTFSRIQAGMTIRDFEALPWSSRLAHDG